MQIKQLIANQLLNLQFDLRIAKHQQTIANELLDLQIDLRIAKFQQLIAVNWTTSLPKLFSTYTLKNSRFERAPS